MRLRAQPPVAAYFLLWTSTSLLSACRAPNMVAYSPAQVSTTQDPDALYGGAIRVFVKKGWGFQSRDEKARAVETEYVRVDRFAGKGALEESYRVLINRGNIEIFTSCRWNDSNIIYKECGNVRRAELPAFEQALVREIVQESEAIVPSNTEANRPSLPTKDPTGCVSTCGKDRQSCFASCGKSDKCKEGCSEGYVACVKACGQ